MASSSPEPAPAGQAPALPQKIAAAGKEELQRMLMDSLRKLKARDKRLTELRAENEGLTRPGAHENGMPNNHQQEQESSAQEKERACKAEAQVQRLQQQLQESRASAEAAVGQLQQDLAAARQQAEHQASELEQRLLAAQQDAQDAEATRAADARQMAAVKELLRAEVEAKEKAQAQAEAVAATAARWESNARGAASAARKAQTELGMLEGVLQTVQDEAQDANTELSRLQESQNEAAQAAEARSTELEAALAAAQSSESKRADTSAARGDHQEQLHEALAAAKHEAATMQDKLQSALRQLAAANEQSSTSASQLKELRAQQDGLTISSPAPDGLHTDLENANRQAEELREQLKSLEAQHKEELDSWIQRAEAASQEQRAAAASSAADDVMPDSNGVSDQTQVLQQALAAAEQRNAEQEAQLAEASRLSQQLQESHKATASLQGQLDDAQQKLSTAHSALAAAEESAGVADAKHQAALQKVLEADEALASTMAQLKEADTRHATAATDWPQPAPALDHATSNGSGPDLPALQARLDEALQQLASAEAARQAAQSQAQHLQQEADQHLHSLQQARDVQDQLAAHQRRTVSLEETTTGLQREKERLQAEVEAAEKQLPALRREAEAGWAAERQLRSLEQASVAGREQAEDAARSLQQQLREAQSQLAAQAADLEAKVAQADEAAAASGQQRIQEAERQLEEARQQLADAEHRLHENVDSSKAAQAKLREQQEAERAKVKRAITELKKGQERALKDARKAEAEALEQLSRIREEHGSATSQLAEAASRSEAAEAASTQLSIQLRDYKARAGTLLKSKDAELRTVHEAAAQEAAQKLTDAETALTSTHQQLDQMRERLEAAEMQHVQALQHVQEAAQDQAQLLHDSSQQAQDAAQSTSTMAEQWRRRHDALEARMEVLRAERRSTREAPPEVLERHAHAVAQLEQDVGHARSELAALRATADKVSEAKDEELSRVLASQAALREEVATLRAMQANGEASSPQTPWLTPGDERDSQGWGSGSVPRRPSNDRAYRTSSFAANIGMVSRRPEHPVEDWGGLGPFGGSAAGSMLRRDSMGSIRSSRVAESGVLDDYPPEDPALLRLAAHQAARHEEVQAARRQVAELEAELGDAQHTLDLQNEQSAALKEALRDMEREKARQKLAEADRQDLTYLKNILLKLFETGEAGALLPVIATMLQFSPQELDKCKHSLAQFEGQAAAKGTAEQPEAGYLGGWRSWAFGASES